MDKKFNISVESILAYAERHGISFNDAMDEMNHHNDEIDKIESAIECAGEY